MKPKLRMLAAIAVGTLILMSVAADADARPGINPNEARWLRHQVQQYHQMKRHAGADGLITRAEQARRLAQRSSMLAFARRMLPRTSAAILLSP